MLNLLNKDKDMPYVLATLIIWNQRRYNDDEINRAAEAIINNIDAVCEDVIKADEWVVKRILICRR